MNIINQLFPRDVANIIHTNVTQLKYHDVIGQLGMLFKRSDRLIEDDESEWEINCFYDALRHDEFFSGFNIYRFYRADEEDTTDFRKTCGSVKKQIHKYEERQKRITTIWKRKYRHFRRIQTELHDDYESESDDNDESCP